MNYKLPGALFWEAVGIPGFGGGESTKEKMNLMDVEDGIRPEIGWVEVLEEPACWLRGMPSC